jgi:16S rRNA (cytidine1402-2'-O)-methyltransferase
VSTLYIVGTPIGNLGDITFRAVETLKAVSLVACEDTRQTLKLLSHLGIRVKLLSLRSQNEEKAAEAVLAVLREGNDVAYVSDAGTPGISDPGSRLTRLAAGQGFEVIPIPGPSAFASLVSVAGGVDKTVVFEGFLSPRGGRRLRRVLELMEAGYAFVLYESPFRVLKLIRDIAGIDMTRYICVGREMTKLHEEYLRGGAGDVLLELEGRQGSKEMKGEFSVYVSGGGAKSKPG